MNNRLKIVSEVVTCQDIVTNLKKKDWSMVLDRGKVIQVTPYVKDFKIDENSIKEILVEDVYSGNFFENINGFSVGDLVCSTIKTTSFEYEYNIYSVIEDITNGVINATLFEDYETALIWAKVKSSQDFMY